MHILLRKILKLFAYILSFVMVLASAPLGSMKAEAADETVPVFEVQQTASPEPSPSISPNDTTVNYMSDLEDIISSNNTNCSEEKLLSLDDINILVAGYGRVTIAGMKPEDYDAVQAISWTPLNTVGEPEPFSINLSDLMNYAEYQKYIQNLDKYTGVEVSIIGSSAQGKNIYMIKAAPGGEEGKPIIMLTGSVHAREFAGAEYITKFLNDTLVKAQSDPAIKALLEKVVIVAVPLVNPDGREMIIDGGSKRRKSNANGVDLNRAMPAVNAGQLVKGVKRVKDFSTKPGLDFFAGYNLGTESETRAMIKWFDYYVPKALVYIDLHQQGGTLLFNKYFVSEKSDAQSKDFAKGIYAILKKGYHIKLESRKYSYDGDGGTLTDYARSVAEGFKYSYAYGRMVLDENGTEVPLVVFKDIDDNMQYYKPVNLSFRAATIEIGRSSSYLGAGSRARTLRKREYAKYNWDGFLQGIINNVLALQN